MHQATQSERHVAASPGNRQWLGCPNRIPTGRGVAGDELGNGAIAALVKEAQANPVPSARERREARLKAGMEVSGK
jgi:hypothetical protein